MTEAVDKTLETAVAAIRQRTRYMPQVGLVLGSGLSDLANAVKSADVIPYAEIPHWPASTVIGHSGQLVIGQLEGQTVLVQQGRAHFYEGYSPAQVVFPVRVMHALGIHTLIVTNAAGGINRSFEPGDLMLIKDHLNFVGIAGNNPLRGPNDERIGPRFPDMTQAYDPALRRLALETAAAQGLKLHEGVYAYVAGPSFETSAELRFLHLIGADAVGMSTVPSVIVARHAGMRVLGISSITNKAILDPTSEAVVSHEEVLETGKMIVPRLTKLLYGLLPQL
ncbi:MAG: purine-nucleoside phosphorylase [Ardenticatenaceae bacterium]|nr:purine-nucleoside phosphorylase [Anaerolineales bacterium]MCB8985147.1 purine-nucleoside phosphorylase [Ardenticatenaceae bacterium]MCB8986690.1 purine-nucleoside phosphorylase [Ardenticatenaceae bacterium]